jgi:hypothetical protein
MRRKKGARVEDTESPRNGISTKGFLSFNLALNDERLSPTADIVDNTTCTKGGSVAGTHDISQNGKE